MMGEEVCQREVYSGQICPFCRERKKIKLTHWRAEEKTEERGWFMRTGDLKDVNEWDEEKDWINLSLRESYMVI